MKVTNDPVLNIYDFLIQKQTEHETKEIISDQDTVVLPLRYDNFEDETPSISNDQESTPNNEIKRQPRKFKHWMIIGLLIIAILIPSCLWGIWFIWGDVILETQLYKDNELLFEKTYQFLQNIYETYLNY